MGFLRISPQHIPVVSFTKFPGYVLKAANEAEKASNITVVDVKAVGAFGRLTLAGKEGDVEEAAAAAIRAIDEISNY